MSNHINITRIKAVNNALRDLRDTVVFVGGSTVSLYADRPVMEVRPTDDVDVIVEILNYSQRQALEERLREIGFVNDIESGITCRFKIAGIIVDIMPTNDETIGFNNRWYPSGFRHAEVFKLNPSESIRILSAPYFIATKLEAFKGRGGNDGRWSHDFEDIVFILENRSVIWEEIESSDDEVKAYLKNEFSSLLENPYFDEWIDAHVERGIMPQTEAILSKIKAFCK